jgi:UDPglucose 6-dehydrogenase
VNAARKQGLAERVAAAMGGEVRGKTIAILGLTFKPNTDDMRDAPALDLVPALHAMGAHLRVFDPQAHEARQLLRDVAFEEGPYEAVAGADAVVILTEWDQFRALDLTRVKDLMREPVMIDLRNVYRPEEMRALGFRYASIGRG